ncbi:hypothetical protein SDC9_195444 [bioreactor metagenome]|uniref:Uncharacterized protein n=1 Tax=bioreactor metagenome TaxID=1076179 RepID=A0A645I9R0_9ZZZZ
MLCVDPALLGQSHGVAGHRSEMAKINSVLAFELDLRAIGAHRHHVRVQDRVLVVRSADRDAQPVAHRAGSLDSAS